MKYFSLRALIDDIMLIIRNNNISESEDFSREQVAAWILSYKSYLLKKRQDADQDDVDDVDDTLTKTLGPLKLEDVEDNPFQRKTIDKLPDLLGDSVDNLISVSDASGCVIQFMHGKRRHYHYFRKYTFAEPVCWYENGYIYVEGMEDGNIDDLFVTGIFADTSDADDADEDDIEIPGWMIPDIKSLIMKNELAFMLRMPSDDENNASLDEIKPQSLNTNHSYYNPYAR